MCGRPRTPQPRPRLLSAHDASGSKGGRACGDDGREHGCDQTNGRDLSLDRPQANLDLLHLVGQVDEGLFRGELHSVPVLDVGGAHFSPFRNSSASSPMLAAFFTASRLAARSAPAIRPSARPLRTTYRMNMTQP